MAATGFTPIQLYRTSTAAAAPSAGNLADGELAINLTDERLYFKNAAGTVKLLAANITPPANGGTGAANGTNNTITFTGNFTLGLTLTGNTSVTLPTSGALATKGNSIAFSILFGL
jgi:urease alpha subunit